MKSLLLAAVLLLAASWTETTKAEDVDEVGSFRSQRQLIVL